MFTELALSFFHEHLQMLQNGAAMMADTMLLWSSSSYSQTSAF